MEHTQTQTRMISVLLILLPEWLLKVRYTLIGAPNAPWTATLWWFLFLIFTVYAWLEAVKEALRCFTELFPYSPGHGAFGKYPRRKLARGALFWWFGPFEEAPWSILICECFLRCILVFCAGMFNGAVSLVVSVFVIPAFFVYILKRFWNARSRYSSSSSGSKKDSSDEDLNKYDDDGSATDS